MGSHPNGEISLGIAFPTDFEFPWGEKSVEDWWLETKGFKPTLFPFTEDGDYITPKPSKEQIDLYYKEKEDFLGANKLPFEEVICYSYDYPSYILAVPKTVITASEGTPEALDFKDLILQESKLKNEIDALVNFVKEYIDELDDVDLEVKWYLSAYYG